MKSKYHKRCPYEFIDVYRILKMFEVDDPCIQHVVKKLLCAGKRGSKSYYTDIDEAHQSLNRFFDMRAEEIFNGEFKEKE